MVDVELIEPGWVLVAGPVQADTYRPHFLPAPGTAVTVLEIMPLTRWVRVQAQDGLPVWMHRSELEYPALPKAPEEPKPKMPKRTN